MTKKDHYRRKARKNQYLEILGQFQKKEKVH